MCRSTNPSNHASPISQRTPYRLLTLLLGAVIVASGCSGKGAKNAVYGKVTLNDQPVAGTVFFYGAKGEKSAGIETDGSYYMTDPPLGEVTVVIKAHEKGPGDAGTQDAKPIIPDSKPTAKEKTKMDLGPVAGAEKPGVTPPAKYGKKESSPLKITVKGQTKEKHDLPLEK
jgi:hypothetical protein